MAVLTTSQLTFYDYKDSYNVEINPDYIVVNCDEKYISKEITNANISYGIYCGRSRVSGTAVLDFEINGEKIEAVVQDCNSESDGTIQFSIPKDIDFTNIESVHIIFSELAVGDGDTFTFDKYVQFIKAVDGSSGTGMVFKIYSEDGTVFREDMKQIKLETVVLIGENSLILDDQDYIWEYDTGNSIWEFLSNGSELIINKSDINALKTIRCTINYNGNTYQDYISLIDDVIIYTSEVKYFNGSNVFNTGDKYLISYMALYKNGEEVDLLKANKFANAASVDAYGKITTTVTPEDPSIPFKNGDLLYFVVPDSNSSNIYNIILGQYDGLNWISISPTQDYVYDNSMEYNNLARSSYNESNKIMIVSKEQVNKSLGISFTAYKKVDNILVSTANGNIIDINDPIVSSLSPENPVNGQLWVDTSRVPYTIKVCKFDIDGNFTWVDSNQQTGSKIHTSQPSVYEINDIWILNDNESCAYIKDGIEYYYGPGSMLRSSAFSTTFNPSDWLEVKSELTEIRDNVAQYFEFNADSGLKIGQKDQKFYVNISAAKMGFYDNSNPSKPNREVVSIGNQAATIKNATMEESATFTCQVDFNNQININQLNGIASFAWKIGPDGSLSLVVNS